MIYSCGGFLKDSNSFQFQHSSSILHHWCMMIYVAEFQWWRYVTDICDVLERPKGQTGCRCLITWRGMGQPQQQISTYINQACCVLHKSFNPLLFGHPCCVFRWCSLPTIGKLVCCRSTWPGDLSTSTTSSAQWSGNEVHRHRAFGNYNDARCMYVCNLRIDDIIWHLRHWRHWRHWDTFRIDVALMLHWCTWDWDAGCWISTFTFMIFTVFSRGNLTKLVTRSFTTWDTRGAIPFDLACRVLLGIF
jgi:hypothetical protein